MAGDPAAVTERVERLRALLAREPEDASAWFGVGHGLLELSRPAEAIEPLERALAIDPRYTAAIRDLGQALLGSGRAEDARSVLARGAEIARDRGDLQTGREIEVFLRRALRALGRDAPPAERRARRRAPLGSGDEPDSAHRGEARSVYRRGFQHFAEGEIDEAIELYRQALAIDPELAIAWNGLSIAHRARRELDEAIEAGLRLIELEPDDPLSHTNLSILYQNKGMIPEAEEERAIAMRLQMQAQGSRDRA